MQLKSLKLQEADPNASARVVIVECNATHPVEMAASIPNGAKVVGLKFYAKTNDLQGGSAYVECEGKFRKCAGVNAGFAPDLQGTGFFISKDGYLTIQTTFVPGNTADYRGRMVIQYQ